MARRIVPTLSEREKKLVQLGVTAAAHLYSLGRTVTKESFMRAAADWEIEITFDEVEQLFPTTATLLSQEFLELCLSRRYINPVSGRHNGLTAKQMVGLAKVSNVLDRRPLSKKLAEINVEWWEWQTWLANPIFSAAYREFSEQNISKHQATVLDALTANAIAGDLRSIEYFNKLSGRFDPNKIETQDARAVVTAIVEILQETLSDQPSVLQEIASKIQRKLNPKELVQ